MGRVDSGASKERAIEKGIMTVGTGGGCVERWVKKIAMGEGVRYF